MTTSHYHHVAFVLAYFCLGCCTIKLEQPPILAATVGSTVNLSCYLQIGNETINRINVYWLSLGLNGTLRQYLYPRVTTGSSRIINKTLIRLSNPGNKTDMSLSVSDVKLSFTDIYVCSVSLVMDTNTSSIPGKGTYLLVHEPLETVLNDTNIICRTKVQTVANLSLLWEFENGRLVNGDHGWFANSGNTYWISTTIPNMTSLCQPPMNSTFTCLLQYRGMTVVRKRMEIACAGTREAHRPVHLYALMLGSSLLLLIIILIIWIRNRWKNMGDANSSPYTNISDLKRMHCF
ncbi:uncharacterized protein [Pyxicephalus adspersus]|uniref:uncharacterized protein isoform X2 n=1 Tax=Pyxicephalus adspersus TaxID=30357 RepID=UPI003B593E24